MGFFENFPYTNFHDMNLDWVLKEIENLKKYIENYTAVNRVAYAGIWDITKQYPQWALVTSEDSTYLSSKPVPVGIPIDNAEYWILLADLDPRIAGIIQNLSVLNNQVSVINNQVSVINNKMAVLPTATSTKLFTVNKNGGAMFATISEAVNEAKQIATKTDRVVVCVYTGDYEEQIELLGNPGIDIVGIGKVTVHGTKAYPNSTLHTTGDGYFANIDFVSVGLSNYSLHIEAQESADPGTRIKFVNCSFYSNDHNAIGVGVGSNYGVEFIGCSFQTNSSDHFSVYAHNYPKGGLYSSFMRFTSCFLFNTGEGKCWRFENARKIHDPTGAISPLYLYLNGNYSRLGGVSVYDGTKEIQYLPQSGEINGENSVGNSDDVNKVSPYVFDGYVPMGANGAFSIPIEICKQYFIASNVNITDVATSRQIQINVVNPRNGAVDITTGGGTGNTVYRVQFALSRP